jgi:hypothetical protein
MQWFSILEELAKKAFNERVTDLSNDTNWQAS